MPNPRSSPAETVQYAISATSADDKLEENGLCLAKPVSGVLPCCPLASWLWDREDCTLMPDRRGVLSLLADRVALCRATSPVIVSIVSPILDGIYKALWAFNS